MATTILIADDHDIIREGIKNILSGQSEYKLVGEAVDGQDALSQTEKIKPDVLLLDISMPKVSGLDIIKKIHQVSSQTKILIISLHQTSAYVIKAFKSGVSGYLSKENAAEELLIALRRVVEGKTYLTSTASTHLVDKIVDKPLAKVKERVLSEREEEILRLVAEGKTAKEIAEILYLSPRTVENYKNSIQEKLKLNKTSDLIKYAIKHGIVDLEEY